MGVVATLLFSMSGLVLLVASFNLANMLLARGSSRQKEFAIRLALGGNRFRLIRQLLAESVVLAVVGGVVATFVAWGSTRLLMTSLSARLPLNLEFETAPDVRILAVTIGLCVLSALLFGLGPAWRHAKTDAVPELKDQAGEVTGGRRSRFATRNVLVMGQLAFSLVTLTAAGMFVRSAMESAAADPGSRSNAAFSSTSIRALPAATSSRQGVSRNRRWRACGRCPESSRRVSARSCRSVNSPRADPCRRPARR